MEKRACRANEHRVLKAFTFVCSLIQKVDFFISKNAEVHQFKKRNMLCSLNIRIIEVHFFLNFLFNVFTSMNSKFCFAISN